ncbi:unnamed protein product [Gordionus sp. m RMFG-2023]
MDFKYELPFSDTAIQHKLNVNSKRFPMLIDLIINWQPLAKLASFVNSVNSFFAIITILTVFNITPTIALKHNPVHTHRDHYNDDLYYYYLFRPDKELNQKNNSTNNNPGFNSQSNIQKSYKYNPKSYGNDGYNIETSKNLDPKKIEKKLTKYEEINKYYKEQEKSKIMRETKQSKGKRRQSQKSPKFLHDSTNNYDKEVADINYKNYYYVDPHKNKVFRRHRPVEPPLTFDETKLLEWDKYFSTVNSRPKQDNRPARQLTYRSFNNNYNGNNNPSYSYYRSIEKPRVVSSQLYDNFKSGENLPASLSLPTDPCYDNISGFPKRCLPDLTNVAFGKKFYSTYSCDSDSSLNIDMLYCYLNASSGFDKNKLSLKTAKRDLDSYDENDSGFADSTDEDGKDLLESGSIKRRSLKFLKPPEDLNSYYALTQWLIKSDIQVANDGNSQNKQHKDRNNYYYTYYKDWEHRNTDVKPKGFGDIFGNTDMHDKVCHKCHSNGRNIITPESIDYLTDLNNPNNRTCWLSAPLRNKHTVHNTEKANDKSDESVNLILSLNKKYELTYVSIQFCGLLPVAMAIYKSTDHRKNWIPFQYYAQDCVKTFQKNPKSQVTKANEQEALCYEYLKTDKKFNILPQPAKLSKNSVAFKLKDNNPFYSPNSSHHQTSSIPHVSIVDSSLYEYGIDNRIAFSTLEGRPSAYDFDSSPVLQDWVTATDIKIVLYPLSSSIFNNKSVFKNLISYNKNSYDNNRIILFPSPLPPFLPTLPFHNNLTSDVTTADLFSARYFAKESNSIERRHIYNYDAYKQEQFNELPSRGLGTVSINPVLPIINTNLSENNNLISSQINNPNVSIFTPSIQWSHNYVYRPNPSIKVIENSNIQKIKSDHLETGDQIYDYTGDYFFGISDISVGGRCKCNGHGSKCVRNSENRMVCDCKHNTDGNECEKCKKFYYDRPWARATDKDVNECLPCKCNLHAKRCQFNMELYKLSGGKSGGVCIGCRHSTAGRHCHYCKEGYYRDPTKHITHRKACKACDCHPVGASGKTCNQTTGQCPCKDGVTGITCNRCSKGYQQSRSPIAPCVNSCKECKASNMKVNQKKFCRKDFAIQARILSRESIGPWIRYTVYLMKIFKGRAFKLKQKEEYLWIKEKHVTCKCRRLKLGEKYLLLGHVSRNSERPGLVINKRGIVILWKEDWRTRMRHLKRRERISKSC